MIILEINNDLKQIYIYPFKKYKIKRKFETLEYHWNDYKKAD